jgi:hypothetical protein
VQFISYDPQTRQQHILGAKTVLQYIAILLKRIAIYCNTLQQNGNIVVYMF